MKIFFFTITLLLNYFCVNAQIITGDTISTGIYYDNLKDTTLLDYYPSASYYLDINNDGLADIEFTNYGYGFQSTVDLHAYAYILNPTVEFAVLPTNNMWLDTMQKGTIIDNTKMWHYSSSAFIIHSYQSWQGSPSSGPGGSSSAGIFSGSNKYLGFSFVNTNDTLYG